MRGFAPNGRAAVHSMDRRFSINALCPLHPMHKGKSTNALSPVLPMHRPPCHVNATPRLRRKPQQQPCTSDDRKTTNCRCMATIKKPWARSEFRERTLALPVRMPRRRPPGRATLDGSGGAVIPTRNASGGRRCGSHPAIRRLALGGFCEEALYAGELRLARTPPLV